MTETAERALDEDIAALALTDHHVHPALASGLAPHEFEGLLTESDRPVPPWMTQFDSQLGVAVRRWCAPVLGLDPFAAPGDYLARRAGLGPGEVTRRLLRASGIGHYLLDTGYQADGMLDLAGMQAASGAAADEIVRLESVAEEALLAGDATAAGFAGGWPRPWPSGCPAPSASRASSATGTGSTSTRSRPPRPRWPRPPGTGCARPS